MHCRRKLMKVNWNVVVDTRNRKMGISVTDQDPMGEVLATLQSPKGIIILAIAESLTVLKEIVFAEEMGWQKVELERDVL